MTSSSHAGPSSESESVQEFESTPQTTDTRGSGLPVKKLRSISAELGTHYEQLLNSLGLDQWADWPKLIALTSCRPGEGVSTIASQLAICATRLPINVLLIDGNSHHPCLHESFKLKASVGFRDYLMNGDLHHSIHPTEITNLSIMPFGSGTNTATPIAEFEEALRELQSEFDLVVLDLPSISTGSYTIGWAPSLTHLLLVVSRKTPTLTAANVKRQLERAGANLKGIVQNLH